LVASSNSFSIWINFSFWIIRTVSHFPPFVLNSRLATHAHLLCARALCVYIEREKRGPSSNVSVHTDTYVMTYFPRKNKKRFLLLLFFFLRCLHTCVQFSLWLELITAHSSWRKDSFFFLVNFITRDRH
jgi:hypothetical protein